MKTLVVNYQSESDKKAFVAENKDSLNEFNVIFVNNRSTDGVRVDVMPEYVG